MLIWISLSSVVAMRVFDIKLRKKKKDVFGCDNILSAVSNFPVGGITRFLNRPTWAEHVILYEPANITCRKFVSDCGRKYGIH